MVAAHFRFLLLLSACFWLVGVGFCSGESEDVQGF